MTCFTQEKATEACKKVWITYLDPPRSVPAESVKRREDRRASVLADGERAAVNVKRPASSAADAEAEPQEASPLGRWLDYFGRVRNVKPYPCGSAGDRLGFQLFSLSRASHTTYWTSIKSNRHVSRTSSAWPSRPSHPGASPMR